MNHIELSIDAFNKDILYNSISNSDLVYELFCCITAMYTVEDLKTLSKKAMYELSSSVADGFLHKKTMKQIRYAAKTNIALQNIETLDYICENVILLINVYNKQKIENRIENILEFPESKLKDSLIRMGLIHGNKKIKKELTNYKLKGN